MPAEHRALIDFPDRDGRPRRRCFHDPDEVIRAESLTEVVPAIDRAERAARDGAWVVGFVSYEAGPAFDRAIAAMPRGRLPLAWFGVHHAGPRAIDAPGASTPSGPLGTPATPVSARRYSADVERIREYIAAGDVYQVNLTIPFVSRGHLHPISIYDRLRAAQRGRWSACLELGDATIMSASPELFFERRGSTVRMRPMKGTAPRGLSSDSDRAARDALLRSEKDRAENVMIVDLVRNDLGRLATLGSVQITALCEAERYPGVFQLTSTVEAEVSAQLPLSALFGALFPCGSVTGAPKVRATQIIRELEQRPREVYCGAVGVIEPGGDAVFNVAIRTAWTIDGGATVHLDAGGAVTIDSTAAGELSEVHAKVAAFTAPRPVPALFETIRVERGAPVRLERHLARMRASAHYFDIPFDEAAARRRFAETAERAGSLAVGRGRLVLDPTGDLHAEVIPFAPEVPGDRLARVALSPEPVRRTERSLYHKTTDRAPYDRALASRPGAFDVLLWNEEGDATEFTRGNLVVELDGELFTPPERCGLLAGTLRGELLERGIVSERVLTLDDVRRATSLRFVNSLRGEIRVVLEE